MAGWRRRGRSAQENCSLRPRERPLWVASVRICALWSIEPPISEFESWFPSHYGYLTLEKEPILSLSFFICSTQQGIRNHFLPVQLTLRCPESRTVLRSKRIPKDICLMESQPLQLLLTPALTPRKLTLQKWSQPASWKNPRDDWSCSRPIFETHNWKLGLLSRTQRFLKSEGT
nr:uncharacterized protein LOC121825012 isoform X2 [Peromyscus maniculatus bairdii]